MSSEVKRYVTTCDCMSPASWGDYVRYDDYAALEERYDCNTAIMHARTEALDRVTAERDALSAELAALKAASGEEIAAENFDGFDLGDGSGAIVCYLEDAQRITAALRGEVEQLSRLLGEHPCEK